MTANLHPIEASELHARRERVFLLLAGIFLGSLTLLNVLGISRFIVLASLVEQEGGGYDFVWGRWGDISFALAVGVLPYPVTFLCTDLVSEFYGRKRANWLVMVGLLLNLWVVFILWLGAALPQQPDFDDDGIPKVNVVEVLSENGDVNHVPQVPPDYAFYRIKQLAYGAVVASMIAYLLAQFCDVWLYHFWKRLTKGKHLWLRNNGSTLVSQLVDTVAVILISHFYARSLPLPPEGASLARHLFLFIITGYVFKVCAALLDTLPFYLAVGWLKKYLEFDPMLERNQAQ